MVRALPEDLEDLGPLIDRLASCGYPHTATVGRWKAIRVPRGRNNVVYRAGAGTQAVAVKFTTLMVATARAASTVRFWRWLKLDWTSRRNH